VTTPQVSFSPKLASVVKEKEVMDSSDNTGPSRGSILLRIGAVALLVTAVGTALHFGTADKRERERRELIDQAIATSGVGSGVSNSSDKESERHE
jgi:hypothetical protein